MLLPFHLLRYWCSQAPPRGQAYNHTTRDTCSGQHHDCGGTQMHMSPAGVVYKGGNVLPNAPGYRNATGAMVQAWRGSAAWYTNGCLVPTTARTGRFASIRTWAATKAARA